MASYPWFAFYPADYLRKVAHLPLATQGLWMWMLCKMDDSPRRGVLLYPNGEPIQEQDIPGMVIDTPGAVRRALDQLEKHAILSREDDTGAMYSRRMVRDSARRDADRERQNRRRVSPSVTPNVTPSVTGNVTGGVTGRTKTITKTIQDVEPEAEPKPEAQGDLESDLDGVGAAVEALSTIGVHRKVASALARGGVTASEAWSEAKAVASDGTARSPVAVLVTRLRDRHGITLPKGGKIAGDALMFSRHIDALRRGRATA